MPKSGEIIGHGPEGEPWALPIDRAPLLAALVESLQDGIVVKTLDGVITLWNPGAERLFGYTAEEIVGKSVLLLEPVDRRDEQSHILASLRQGEPVRNYETVRVRKDGTRLAVSLSVSPIWSSDGTILGGATIARDIAAEKQAEERFRLVFEAAPNGMMMIGADGRIVLANSSMEKLFGYPKGELLNLTFRTSARHFPRISSPARRRSQRGRGH